MRVPSFLRDRTVVLLLVPLAVAVAIFGLSRLGGDSPAQERAAQASTTTTTTASTTTTPGGASSEVAGATESATGSEGATAEVLGIQQDNAFGAGESLVGAGITDTATTDALTATFETGGVVEEPPAPEPPAPTTVPTTVPPTPTTVAPTTTTTATTTTTTVPSIQTVSRTVSLAFTCTVVDTSDPNAVAVPFPANGVVGISTLAAVPSGQGLPVLVGLLAPPNGLGEVGRAELAQSVRISVDGSGSTPQQLATVNRLALANGAVVPIPDGGDDFLAASFAVTASPGASVTVRLGTVKYSRTVGGRVLEQRCDPVDSAAAALVVVPVAVPGATTTTVALPPPALPESPVSALIPITGALMVGLGLAWVVRRRRRPQTGKAGAS